MSTTGTTAFNLEFTELAEEAWERAGREMRSGYDLRTARRSLNLMCIEWANRGINMWTIETGTITLTQGLNTYALPTDTIDLMDHVIRTQPNVASTQSDLSITRISVSTYATIPNKLTQGRPIQVWIQRLSGEVFRGQNNTTAATHTTLTAVKVPQLPAITVWPTPDGSQTYQFVYYRLRRVQDAGKGVETADMNFRFLPAVTAGLAYYIAMKVPELMGRLDMLKAVYEEQYKLAAGEDREKATLRLVPRMSFIGGGGM